MNMPARLQSAFDGRPEAKGTTPAVVLWNPKYAHNVASALRACACFDAVELWWTGIRVHVDEMAGDRLPREERMKGYRNVALAHADRPFERFDRGVAVVGVELHAQSEPLTMFEHPRDAVYVFGPEDGGLSKGVRACCHRFVHIPARHCLNLAAAVSCTLMHRWQQEELLGHRKSGTLGDVLAESRGD